MYSGPVRAALHALKYGGERRLAAPLASALADRWRQAGRGGEVVTWVPVHPSRQRERGFDQAEELARLMAAAPARPGTGAAGHQHDQRVLGLTRAERAPQGRLGPVGG